MPKESLDNYLLQTGVELERAALILSFEANRLKQIGHAKAAEVDKLRSKLNGIIRSISAHGTRSDSARR